MASLSKWHAAWIGLAAGVCLIASVSAWRRHSLPAGPVRVTSAQPSRAQPGTNAPGDGPIYVHVTGQVGRPGLYRLANGARVMDAITAAGGPTSQADVEALNLATPLRDGQKLTVPSLGQPSPPAQQEYIADSPALEPPAASTTSPSIPPEQPRAGSDMSVDASQTLTADDIPTPRSSPSRSAKLRNPGEGVVDINAGTLSDLERLPGVGPATAKKIVDYREEHGGFNTIDELMEVRGIGPAKLRKMKPFVVLHARGE